MVSNEFAAVRVTIDRSGSDPRLRIEDLTEGHVLYLDAFQLSALAGSAKDATMAWMIPRDLDAEE